MSLQDVALEMPKCLEAFVITAGRAIGAPRRTASAGKSMVQSLPRLRNVGKRIRPYCAEVDNDRAKHDRKLSAP